MATELPADQMTTAQVNGHPVAVHQPHRRWTAEDYVPGAPYGGRYEPLAVTVSAPISLSLEDLAVVLFDWNMSEDDLADENLVRELVASAVVGFGCLRIEELRCTLGERRLDAEQVAYLAYCRQRATTVFGIGATGFPDAARVLAGVS